jgi:hypothetical protein
LSLGSILVTNNGKEFSRVKGLKIENWVDCYNIHVVCSKIFSVMLFTFRVQIANIRKPPVWRKLMVLDNFSFDDFHRVIQIAFGWQGLHPYQFSEKGDKAELFIGEPSVYSWVEIRDSLKMKLSQVFQKKGQKFIYTYDSGDNWKHIITLEAITEGKSKFADCIDGKGNCPPEDCGGPWGYEDLKLIVTDPQNSEYISIREYLGLDEDKEFDPAFFDLEATRQLVKSI